MLYLIQRAMAHDQEDQVWLKTIECGPVWMIINNEKRWTILIEERMAIVIISDE